MPFFSKILGAKKAADAHRKASIAAETPPEPKKEEKPYRHIPTHALSDSLNLGAGLATHDLHERIREENRRHSKQPLLRRTGSDTYLAHRASLAAQREARDTAILLQNAEGIPVPSPTLDKGKVPMRSPQRKVQMHLPLPPTSNPYAMPAALQSPKRLAGSRSGSAKGSPVASVRSAARSPLAESIAGESLSRSEFSSNRCGS